MKKKKKNPRKCPCIGCDQILLCGEEDSDSLCVSYLDWRKYIDRFKEYEWNIE